MKRITYLLLAGLTLALVSAIASAQSSPSLGDFARAARKDKKTTAKQFDNDNLPKVDKLSVVGAAPAADAASSDKPADDSAQPQDAAQTQDAAKSDAKTPAPAADTASKPAAESNDDASAKQQMYESWKNKISAQKDKIDLLTRELDVMQREYRLRAAAFYADAGNRLRNSGSWDQEDAKYKQQIDDKQKAVDAARQQLEDMQDQARKAGVPTGMRE